MTGKIGNDDVVLMEEVAGETGPDLPIRGKTMQQENLPAVCAHAAAVKRYGNLVDDDLLGSQPIKTRLQPSAMPV
jgi:hypothetical protein